MKQQTVLSNCASAGDFHRKSLLGFSRQAISKWERGESVPDVDNAIRLGRLYGISLDELFGVKPEYERELDEEAEAEAGLEPESGLEAEERLSYEEAVEDGGAVCGADCAAEGGESLVINARANVLLRAAEVEQVSVDISGPEKEIAQCSVRREEGTLIIETPEAKRRFAFIGEGRPKMLIKALLPARMKNIEVSLKGGELKIEGAEASGINAKTGGGDVTANRCTAKRFEIKTGGGDIEAEDIRARIAQLVTGGGEISARGLEIAENASVATGGGDIGLECTAKGVEVRSGGGDLSLSLAASSVDVKTGGGDIKLKCAGAEDIEVKTGGGDIEMTFSGCGGASVDLACGGGTAALIAGDEVVARGRRVQAVTGGGKANVTARSGGGDIKAVVLE